MAFVQRLECDFCGGLIEMEDESLRYYYLCRPDTDEAMKNRTWVAASWGIDEERAEMAEYSASIPIACSADCAVHLDRPELVEEEDEPDTDLLPEVQ